MSAKWGWCWLVGTLWLIILNGSAVADHQTIEVRILPDSVVYGEYYVLGDIAELDGFDVETIQKLAKLQIGKSPIPGRSHLITRGQVENRLRHPVAGNTIKIIHPVKAMVSRAALKISGEQLHQIVLDEVKKHYQGYDDIKIDIRTQLEDVFIPKGNASYRINRIGDSVAIGGYSSWMLSLMLDETEVKKLLIRLKVQVFDQVVVAKDPIAKGSQIEAEHLQQIKKDISKERKGYASDPDLVVGEYARRDIYQNEAVDANLVEKPIIVSKGDQIKIVYRTTSLYLSNLAMAMKDGREGDVIPFRTLDSKKTIYAVIKDPKNAEISL